MASYTRSRPTRTTPSLPLGLLVVLALRPHPLIQATWRAEPALRGVPLVVADPGGRIRAVCPRMAGVRPGDHLSRARLSVPDLTVRSPDHDGARVLYEEMLDILSTLSPLVEATDPTAGVAAFDARGLALLWGDDERSWDALSPARAAVARLAALGLTAAAGTGTTRLHARLACGRAPGGAALSWPAGEEALEGVAIDDPALTLRPDAISALCAVGVGTAAAFLRLPAPAVADRLGPAAGAVHALLSGRTLPPLRPWAPPERLVAHVALDGVVDAAALDGVLVVLCTRLHQKIDARGIAVGMLTLVLDDEDGGRRTSHVSYWPPLSERTALERAAHALGARLTLVAPLTSATLSAADPRPPTTEAPRLFAETGGRARTRLDAVFAAQARRSSRDPQAHWRRDPHAPDGWTRREGALS